MRSSLSRCVAADGAGQAVPMDQERRVGIGRIEELDYFDSEPLEDD
jgi:hypothetical protein